MELNPQSCLLGATTSDPSDNTVNAVTLFLAETLPVEPKSDNIHLSDLESALNLQLGLPLSPDLSNIKPTLIPLLSTLYERINVTPNEILTTTESYIKRYADKTAPCSMPPSHHQRAFVDSLLHYSKHHTIVSPHHLAAQSYFQQLARNAFLDEILQKHYYQYTGMLALIERLDRAQKEKILITIREQDIVLRSAAASFLNQDVFIGAAALWQHYLNETDHGSPLSRLEAENIFLSIKKALTS